MVFNSAYNTATILNSGLAWPDGCVCMCSSIVKKTFKIVVAMMETKSRTTLKGKPSKPE